MASPLSADAFTIIDSPSSSIEDSLDPAGIYPHQISTDYKSYFSNKSADLDVQLTDALRRQYPSHTLTIIFESNCPLLAFAASGHATASIDNKTEPFISYRAFVRGGLRGQPGRLADISRFAKYNYVWEGGEFIVYRVQYGYSFLQYILCEPVGRENSESHSVIVDGLIRAVGEWLNKVDDCVYVFDGSWSKSRALYEEIQKARWDDVILDEELKQSLTELVGKFFDSKDVYDDLGVPWKRGIILYGPPGNGKTISIKALMHTVSARKTFTPSLYVKSAMGTYAIRRVFAMARQMAPCLLIFEDIDTIVNINTRAYFFNEVDGLESNDGIMMVASTNYLERLDPGLTKRPSRFDRKYLFPLPNQSERTQYCSYWRHKLNSRPANKIDFPEKLSPALALLMDGFSFAYMKEAFVSSLLAIAGERQESRNENDGQNEGSDNGDDVDSYQIYREMKKQVKLLREDMGKTKLNRLSLAKLLSSRQTRVHATPALPIAKDKWKSVFDVKAQVGGFPMTYEVELKGHTKPHGSDNALLNSNAPANNSTSEQANGSKVLPAISTTKHDKDWKSAFKVTAQIGNFPFLHDIEVECNSRRIDNNPSSLHVQPTSRDQIQTMLHELKTLSPPSIGHPMESYHPHCQSIDHPFAPVPLSPLTLNDPLGTHSEMMQPVQFAGSLPYRQRPGIPDEHMPGLDPFRERLSFGRLDVLEKDQSTLVEDDVPRSDDDGSAPF